MGKRERIRPLKESKKPSHGLHSTVEKIKAKLKWLDPFTYADMLLERIGQLENKLIAWPIYLLTAFFSAWIIYTALGLILGTKSPMVIVLSGSMEPTFYRGDIMVLKGTSFDDLKAQEIVLQDSIAGRKFQEYATTYCSINDSQELVECRYFIPSQGNYTKPFYDIKTGQLCIPDAKRCIFVGTVSKIDIQTKEVCFKGNSKCLELTKQGDIVVYTSDTLGIPIIHRAVAKIRATDGNFVITKGDSVRNNFIDQEAGIASCAVSVASLDGKVIFMIPKLGYVKLILVDDLACIIRSVVVHGNISECTNRPEGFP